mmetsp:Transcript_23003/g.58332  ORF Transcript_23003/g.58332 Transcript_23003/m.58332 type:complete len:356 (-) Transcript_23003:121-1188(-)
MYTKQNTTRHARVLAVCIVFFCTFSTTSSYNFDRFYSLLPEWLKQFKTGQGVAEYSYARLDSKPSMYGVADVVELAYSVGGSIWAEVAWNANDFADMLNSFQEAETGKYKKRYTLQYWEHGTAFAIASLKLLNKTSLYPLHFLQDVSSKEKLYWFLDTCDWSEVWSGSHQIAGIPAVVIMNGTLPYDNYWEDYFSYLEKYVSPKTGFWGRELAPLLPKLFEMGGATHMYWVYHARGQPLLYPKQIVDSTLALQQSNGLYGSGVPYCRDLDGMFDSYTASIQSGGYRKEDVMQAMKKTMDTIEIVMNDEKQLFEQYTNTHHLAGVVQAAAYGCKILRNCTGVAATWRSALDVVPWM